MALVGRSYIEMDVSLTAALSKITQLERRANEAKQALAQPVAIGTGAGAGGTDAAILSFKEMEAELAKVDAGLAATTVKTNEQAIAESKLAASLGDHTRAIELLEAQITKENAETVEGIRLATQITQLENQQTQALTRQADVRVRVASAEARALAIKKDFTGALNIVRTTQEAETNASAGALSQLGVQAAQYEVAGTAAGAFGAHIGALLNPLTLAVAGIGLATKALSSFGDALEFGGKLEEERTSFGGILGDFQKGNAILDEATQRGRAYGFTQKEVTDAFRELAPIIAESTSSTKDQSEALARISILKPDAPVKALTSAIEGIKTGRIRELSKELGLTKPEQDALTLSVAQGKDAFVALNDVLDKHGITLDVAKTRTQGLAGAERDQAQAAEDLAKSESEFGSGAGIAFTQLKTAGIRALNDIVTSPGGRLLFAANTGVGIGNEIGRSLFNAAPAPQPQQPAPQGGGTAALTNEQSDQIAQAQRVGAAFDEERQKLGALQVALGTSEGAIQKSADASALDAEAKKLQAAANSKTAFEADQAATAFIKLNPNLDASQAFAAAAAAGLFPLAQRIIATRIEAAKLRAELLNEQLDTQTTRQLTGADSDEAGIRAGKHAGVVAGRAQGQAQASAAAEAQRQADAAAGNLTPALTHAQAELNQLAKDGKTNTAEYINKQQEITDLQQKQAAQGQQALDDQIDLAKATGDTARARALLNQELASAKASGDAGAQAKALEALKALDKAKGAPGGKGISALDKSELALITDKQARLDQINAILEKGNLTQLQRNQYLKEQHDLQDQINDAVSKQRDLEIDIALAETHDAQDDLKAKREAAGLQRALAGGKLSADQQEAARLRLSELSLENAKRENDIGDKQRQQGKLGRDFGKALDTSKAVGVVPATGGLAPSQAGARAITPQVPIPSAAQIAAAAGVVVNLAITIDGQTGAVTKTTFDPSTILNVIGNAANFRNLSGGAP